MFLSVRANLGIRLMRNRIVETLDKLKRSSFRSKFKLNQRDLVYIQNKGIETIRKHAFDFITSRVGPQFPKNDGKQTPRKGHPVFVAQHATGTCCRGCIEKWHGIKRGNALTDRQITFIVDLIMGWIERQMVVHLTNQCINTKSG